MASGTVGEGSKEKQRWADSKVYRRKSFKGLKSDENNSLGPETAAQDDDAYSSQQQQLLSRFDTVSDDSSNLNRSLLVPPSSRVNVLKRQVSEVTINLRSKSKNEMLELRRKLEGELDLVRNLVKKIEGRERKVNAGVNNNGGAKRVHLQQLSVSVIENSQGLSDNVEKEKRTPKANPLYQNSEFLLARDKFPPSDGNKKTKPNGKKQGGSDLGHGFGSGMFLNKVLKKCSALLEKLMKHKHGWVFNTPVDPVALGLHDYLDIIKHPMDLGTVKSRLNMNWYKSPREFAEDVRLTFGNAMTYNPKGQDVHVMAEQLLNIFEEKWAGVEFDYMQESRMAVNTEVSLSTPTSRKGHSLVSPPAVTKRILNRSESVINPADGNPKAMGHAHSGRTPASKKPKARDPDKRDMTYEEKQKLSNNLQSLPSDKLDDVVKIIKKRNTSLCQNDDEIEVDIDSVDTETLWELDRFVTNYKKSLSKNKRKAELDIKARAEAEPDAHTKNPVPTVVDEPKETKSDEKHVSSPSPVQVKQQGDANKSSSSSSSSSGSGSSSSDSESGSSSGNGSDKGHSPRTHV